MTFSKLLAGALVLAITSSTTFAFVVSAPAVEAQLSMLNARTQINHQINQAKWLEQIQKSVQILKTGMAQVDEIRNQIQQGKQQFDFWKAHAGNWQGIVAAVRTQATDAALKSGTFGTQSPGMTAEDLLGKNSTLGEIAKAVDETKELLSGENSKMLPGDLRNAITKIVGRIPQSEAAGVTTFAQTSIEDDVAFIAKANKAIVQLQEEKARIKKERDSKIGAGAYTEAHQKQYEMADKDIESQIQSMQLQALLRLGQQMVVANSFTVKNQNDLEERQNHERRLRAASQTLLGQ